MKKIVLIIIFLLLFFKIFFPKEFINDLLKLANKYYQNSHFDKAIDFYTKVIKLDPEHAEAYYNRGKSYQYKKMDNIVVKDFARAIELKKEYKNILIELGNYYYYYKKYDRSLFYFMKDIEVNPDNKNGTMIFLKRSNILILKQSFNIKITGKTEKFRLILKIPDNYDKRQVIYDTEYSRDATKIFNENNNKYIEYIMKDPTGDINIDIKTTLEILPYDFRIATQKKINQI